MRRTAIGALLLVTLLVAASCGSDEPKTTSNTGGLPTHDADLAGMLTATAPKGDCKIGISVPNLRDPFYIALAYGEVDEAERWGCKVVGVRDAGGYANLNDQISQIENLAQLGPNVILLSAADYDGTGAVACEMARRGIKVINVATMSNCDQVTYGVNTYDPAVGQKMAEWLGGKNPNAKVVLLSGPAGANWSMERAEGFKKTIAEKYPGIKVLAEKNTDIDPAQAQQVMEDWLTAFPEIDAVIGISDLLGSGASRALQGADRKSKTLVVTSTMSEEAEAGLKSDKLDYVIAERPVLTGRLGTQLAIKALNGEQVKLPDFQPLITVPSAVFYVDQVGYTAADLSNYNSSMDRAPADFNPSKT